MKCLLLESILIVTRPLKYQKYQWLLSIQVTPPNVPTQLDMYTSQHYMKTLVKFQNLSTEKNI